ncbi:hypothetical protein BDV96DRAFT_689605 [Lophiotrema nucula]|uniref:Uncharacterized protein n=1 Tax=Lophiotrema nucula TaxID=690887 RepID=A0A6A5YYR5_9PLEO|nr:hypothetical protein BDV96DRAFT_689605 [Lophiotrema nucula]
MKTTLFLIAAILGLTTASPIQPLVNRQCQNYKPNCNDECGNIHETAQYCTCNHGNIPGFCTGLWQSYYQCCAEHA